MKGKNSFVDRCREKRAIWKKRENGENIFLEVLANRFRLTSKLISRIKKQQSCLWPTFYQMDFMKR